MAADCDAYLAEKRRTPTSDSYTYLPEHPDGPVVRRTPCT